MGQSIQECGPSKICGRQPLKNLKGYGLLRLSSTNFTWPTLEYIASHVNKSPKRLLTILFPLDTGRKLNVNKTFRRNWLTKKQIKMLEKRKNGSYTKTMLPRNWLMFFFFFFFFFFWKKNKNKKQNKTKNKQTNKKETQKQRTLKLVVIINHC